MTSDNALQSRALSRILQEIINEQKCKSPHTMAEGSKNMSYRRVSDLNHGIAPGMNNSPKLLRQLSKMSVCADHVLESIISDYEIKPRIDSAKKPPTRKPALNLSPNTHKMDTDGRGEGRERCLQKSGVVDGGIQTPTQEPLDVTIQNLSAAASSLASPTELATHSNLNNIPRSRPFDPHLFEKMCKLPSSLLDFLKPRTPTSSYKSSSPSQMYRPTDDKLIGVAASFVQK